MAEIQIRNVSKDFLDASGKPFHALKDISFTWNKGENISFTGESGSGKSTIARLLIGLERPTSGEILLDGENIAKWSYGQWRSHRTKIQAVFQDATGSLNRRRSVEHNLEEALRNLTKLSSQERKQRILELMDLTATNRKLLDTPTKNLSGGEQRRVALLRALAVRPDYLILDELWKGFLSTRMIIRLRGARLSAPLVVFEIGNTTMPLRPNAAAHAGEETAASSVRPKDTYKASLTCFIVRSSKWPIFSFRRRLSIVRICSSRMTEFFASPPSVCTDMCVGRRALPVWLVIAAAITVGLYLFPMSF